VRIRTVVIAVVAAALGLGSTTAHAQETAPGSEPGVVRPEKMGPLQINVITTTVGGDRADMVPAGSRAVVSLTVMNVEDSAASGVSLRIGTIKGATVVDGTATFGDLSPKEEATKSVTLDVGESDCTGSVEAEGLFTSSLGDQTIPFGFAVACPGPSLYVSQAIFKTSDGDEIPEPGERVEILVHLYNSGRDPATDARGTITLADASFIVERGTATWPTIAAGASAAANDPFVITIPKDAKAQENPCGSVSILPAPGTEDTRTSDDAVVSSDDQGASDQPVSGGGTGGSTGSTAVEPDPALKDPEPAGSTEPAPAPDEPIEPAPADPSVQIEGKLIVDASGTSFDLPLGNGVVCALEGRPAGGPAPAGPTSKGGGSNVAIDDRLAAARESGDGSSSPAPVAMLLLVTAVAVLARYRFGRAMR
jgi:hypothetical protein